MKGGSMKDGSTKDGSTRDVVSRISDPEIPLRDRLFQLLSVIALAEYILVSGYTIVSGGSIRHVVLMLFGTVLFAVTVSLTFRTGRIRLGAAVSGLLYFLIYPLTFFSSGGMYGGAPVTFTFALVYVFLVTQKWERVLSLAVCVMGAAACFIISYLHPETLAERTALAEHVESFLSIILVALLLCTLFGFVTAVYTTENRIVQKQKKEIENLNQAQKRFFSSMSHEIRTPVNAIIGLNEMTMREELSEEVLENSRNIEVAGQILLHTVNEILDMSSLETGALKLQPGNYYTSAMLSDIVGVTWMRAEEKGLEFRIQADPSLPSQLYGDEMRIKQILLNVITNAVKYTKEGSITFSVRGEKDPSGAFRMIYDVTDTGIGIREENIPHLFTAFQRLDEQENRTIEGTGLGLTIVKQLLDKMDGSVTVTSEYGNGSTFHIEIPQVIADESPLGEFRRSGAGNSAGASQQQSPHNAVSPAAAQQIQHTRSGAMQVAQQERSLQNAGNSAGAPQAQHTADPPVASPQAPQHLDASSMRILAVDDTPMNLMVVKKLLRDTGAAIDTAASGAEALEKTMTAFYDVILMDHQMPEMDGIECLHRIRTQENGLCRSSRILCLTANVGAGMEDTYREEGFDGYLPKPIRGAALEDALRQVLS